MSDHPTFDETYGRYEFSRLVHLGIMVGKWLRRMLSLARTRGVVRPGAGHIRHAD